MIKEWIEEYNPQNEEEILVGASASINSTHATPLTHH